MINRGTICLNTNSMAWTDFSLHYKGTLMTLKTETDTTALNKKKSKAEILQSFFMCYPSSCECLMRNILQIPLGCSIAS